jgi:hypothetical protein
MECKILIGQKAICEHLRIGKRGFYSLQRSGAPIVKGIFGWQTHVDLLDEFFLRQIESIQLKSKKEK